MPKPIAYFTQLYPGLTQTFIYREVQALRDRQIPVRTFSVWHPETDDLPPETHPLMEETFYIFPLAWGSLLAAHLRYILRRPLRYFGALIFMLTRPGTPLRNRWRSLMHFIYGMLAIREMERAQVKHIHVHFAWSASSIALIAFRILDIPFSLTLHSNEIYFDRLLIETKLRYARFVVTISDYNRRLLTELWPDSGVADKIHVIHCGLDPDLFKSAQEEATVKPENTRENGTLELVGVGQLAPRKGFHVLIEACHHLTQRGVPFHCHIFGEGPERSRLEALCEKYDLRDRVWMPGRIYQQDLRQFLAQADVFVLPCVKDKSGDLDGIPVVLMEAMAMELPTVSTHVSGIPELIHHGQNGLLAQPGDAQVLADLLQHLANHPELATRLAKAGRQTVVNEFNIHLSAEQMATLFQKAC